MWNSIEKKAAELVEAESFAVFNVLYLLTPFSHAGRQKLQNATCYDIKSNQTIYFNQTKKGTFELSGRDNKKVKLQSQSQDIITCNSTVVAHSKA